MNKIKVVRIKPNLPKNEDIYFYIGTNTAKGSQNGKIMAENIKKINSCKINEPLPLINPGKKPDMLTFMHCLDIYENNQIYYRGNIDKLISLEKWFCSIPEPYSFGENWSKREQNRKRYGVSDYCDPIIRKLLLSKITCLLSPNKTS